MKIDVPPGRRHPPPCNVKLFTEFYHITHNSNIQSIMSHGILSHNEVYRRKLAHCDISDPDVQSRRRQREPVYHRIIHDYAPLYLNPKNPMLFVRRSMQDQVAILVVSHAVLQPGNHIYSDGNAASNATHFGADRQIVQLSEDILLAPYWADFVDGRRRRCAEVLVYPSVAPTFIVRAICRCGNLASRIRQQCNLATCIDPSFFF